MDRLRELQTLIAIVETGSLVAAARRLGRSAPSITRDLADLEERLGVRLVERSTRACQPTSAGLRLTDDARVLLVGYEEAMAQVVEEATAPRGSVRMTAPTTFGGSHVVPLVLSFLDLYPEISVDLQLSDTVLDLVAEDYDLAVRIGQPSDSAMMKRSVGELRRILVASPAYLAMRGTPRRPADLCNHDIILHGSRGDGKTLSFLDERGQTISFAARGRFTVNQPEAAMAAAREGRGIVRLLAHQGDRDLRAGALVRILPAFEPAPLPVNLLWPGSRHGWRRIRLLVDHFAEGLGALMFAR